MPRFSTRALRALAAAALASTALGCMPPAPLPGRVEPEVDAGEELDAALGPDAAVVPEDPCAPAVSPVPTGDHNPGQSCISASCHDGGSVGAGSPHWGAAGTLFATASGGRAVSGATVRLTDANGVEVEVVTSAMGNFWTDADLALPLTVRVSRCPDIREMVAPAASGSCNSAGCHGVADDRAHLP